MEDLFNRISNLLVPNERIPLLNGDFYTYLNPSPTRINGELFPLAFQYRISATQTKRVTINLIHAMYQHHLNNGVMPSKAEMLAQFPFELCSRPCNFTAAIYIIQKLISVDVNNK
jgi:hypothetical protein